MGEDRWLCTLLIENGYRLEYSALAQDSTYCPETFNEFYNQRRRWIASTIANIAKVIGNNSSITANNDSITVLFILYQAITFFSTLVSPATVILIIVTGLEAFDPTFLNEVPLLVTLCVISVLYGVICIYTSEQTQINVAKILTFVFSIIMAVVISGVLKETVDVASTGDDWKLKNSTDSNLIQVDFGVVYLGVFVTTFIITGLLHANEIFGLLHFIWYLLCLPSGYLFLMIYAFCNINNRSWGTREGATVTHNKSQSWLQYFLYLRNQSISCCKILCMGGNTNLSADKTALTPLLAETEPKTDHIDDALHPIPELSDEVKYWLKDNKCVSLLHLTFTVLQL